MLKEKLLSAFDKLEIDSKIITDNTHLSNELGMDSQEFIELFYLLDKEFHIKLSSDLIPKISTFESLLTLVDLQNLASHSGTIQ